MILRASVVSGPIFLVPFVLLRETMIFLVFFVFVLPYSNMPDSFTPGKGSPSRWVENPSCRLPCLRLRSSWGMRPIGVDVRRG